jgi:hypothetical protein
MQYGRSRNSHTIAIWTELLSRYWEMLNQEVLYAFFSSWKRYEKTGAINFFF